MCIFTCVCPLNEIYIASLHTLVNTIKLLLLYVFLLNCFGHKVSVLETILNNILIRATASKCRIRLSDRKNCGMC